MNNSYVRCSVAARVNRVALTRVLISAVVLSILCNARDARAQEQSDSAHGTAEVLVTAQKREERIQDVPVPVTVIDADQLADTSQVQIRDYFSSVPGFSDMTHYSASQDLSIRGITTGGFSNPTVAVSVDDVPFGNSSNLGSGIVPDIDPGDLARIEVLRGPQGTLYGANSLGGLVKYVTKDPSTDAVSGRISAGTSGVQNGAEPGYDVRASVNVPLGDSFALRASVFGRQDPGYIDNPALNINGVNKGESDGARLAALWMPSNSVSVKLSAQLQNNKQTGVSEVDVPTAGFPQTAGLGDLQQNYIAGSGGYNVGGFYKTVQVYSAIVKARIGGIDLASITGFNIIRLRDSLDLGAGYPGISAGSESLFGVTGVPYADYYVTDKLTQELRLSGSLWQRFDWLAGGFYTREISHGSDAWLASNPTTGQVFGTSVLYFYPRNIYQEYSGFVNLTYHLTDKFDVQVGVRESHFSYTQDPQSISGLGVPIFDGVPSPIISPQAEATSNAFTYLLTPRFEISSDLMLYARLASGYRPGGPNTAGAGTPLQFSPDKTQNYEIGIKGEFLDHTVSVDASVYYIDWKNLQIQLRKNLANGAYAFYTGNGSKAKSEGVEFSTTWRPITGMSIAGWVSYDDAALAEDFPVDSSAYGKAGDRLPNSSRWTANVSPQQDFPLWGESTGFVGATVSYIGGRLGTFQATPARQVYPSYTRSDLRAGVQYESWKTSLYVNNVSDARGVLDGGVGYLYPFAFVYIQPRTIGVSVAKSF